MLQLSGIPLFLQLGYDRARAGVSFQNSLLFSFFSLSSFTFIIVFFFPGSNFNFSFCSLKIKRIINFFLTLSQILTSTTTSSLSSTLSSVTFSSRFLDVPLINFEKHPMETEFQSNPGNFEYMGRNFSDLSINDNSSSAFSDCNSDRSGEFPTSSSPSRQLLIARASENSDEFIHRLVYNLESSTIDEQKHAAFEIRLLAKNKPESRSKIAGAGAIKPLVSIMSSSDSQLQEYGVTAILNLSLSDENKEQITSAGAIPQLVKALKVGNSTAKENAACALLRLSQLDANKIAIGRAGAIQPLVNLLEYGNFRGKKDASTALYSLCSLKENRIRALQSGILKPLVELMADFESNMVDKSAFVLSLLVSLPEARTAVVEEGGIPVLVEIVEVGSQRQKEIAVAILLQLCEDSLTCRTMVAREGAIPPLVALSQSGTSRAKQKAERLIELLRQPRSGNTAAAPRSSEVPV